VFQTVDLWDEVEAAPARDLRLTCDDARIPTDERNLVLRAAMLLQERHPSVDSGASLHLRKRIPSGGGLGGGSSDAAGALVILSRLWDLPRTLEDLEPIAAELGADVPFFLTGGTVAGRGRGDRIEPLSFLGEVPVLLGLPPFAIATADVYRSLPNPLTPHANGVTVSRLSMGLPREKGDLGINDLESVVFRDWPVLATFRDALLQAGAHTALLSGSGSTVFGIFETEGELLRSLESLEARHPTWSLVPTRTIESGIRVAAAS
jgi:4-diphosphocytidyl-2-C-methyl-D-erythritol kinase